MKSVSLFAFMIVMLSIAVGCSSTNATDDTIPIAVHNEAVRSARVQGQTLTIYRFSNDPSNSSAINADKIPLPIDFNRVKIVIDTKARGTFFSATGFWNFKSGWLRSTHVNEMTVTVRTPELQKQWEDAFRQSQDVVPQVSKN